MEKSKKNVLITGNAGFIGSKFASWLNRSHPEYHIVGVDNMTGGFRENIDPEIEQYTCDINGSQFSEIFDSHEFEFVFHFASYAAEGLSFYIPYHITMNNVAITDRVIAECVKHGVGRLVFASSMSVYGRGDRNGCVFNESDTPHPEDPYAVSKYACEMNIRNMDRHFGFEWCIVRPHNVYGPGQNIWDRYRNVLGIWVYCALHGKTALIYGDGRQERYFSYIDDILPCIWNAAVSPAASRRTVNLGGDIGCTIAEAAETFKNVTGYGNFMHAELRDEVAVTRPSAELSREILGYSHTTPLRDGLKEMWRWALTCPERERPKWECYEINKDVYTYWR